MVGTRRPRDFLVKFGTGTGMGSEEEIGLETGWERRVLLAEVLDEAERVA
jgi:hypothetical protein